MKQKILIVDDEPDVLELIQFNLKASGFEVLTAEDGETALRRAADKQPGLIILDLMLPGMDGFEVCKALRKDAATKGIPIIMLTAKAAEIDRVLGFEFGADDYVTKPFSPRELVLRIKALLRRMEPDKELADILCAGPLRIDLPRHEVTVQGQTVELTAKEFRLLTTLVQQQNRVLTREKLLNDVWEYDSLIDTRTVDTHIRRLREKLGAAAKYIDTIRGTGYRFVAPRD